MRHFEQEKDVDGAEGFVEILKKAVDHVGEDVFELLVRTYAVAGMKSPMMRRRLKMEKVEVSDATKQLLEPIHENITGCIDLVSLGGRKLGEARIVTCPRSRRRSETTSQPLPIATRLKT
ncbi:hypothetical protein V6N11_067538 [Hibiscus sabdariffa]|uniref:Uncharacterized protein n=1 Tax=Hibiscus sabdariffa TaxID=183260 RepID=A0ABR2SR63_9ROSI